MVENQVNYLKAARWVTLSGSFTPEELRAIARKVDKDFKKFTKEQDGDKDRSV